MGERSRPGRLITEHLHRVGWVVLMMAIVVGAEGVNEATHGEMLTSVVLLLVALALLGAWYAVRRWEDR